MITHKTQGCFYFSMHKKKGWLTLTYYGACSTPIAESCKKLTVKNTVNGVK